MNIRELLIKIGLDGSDKAVGDLDRVDRATDRTKRGFEALNGVLTTLFTGGALLKIGAVAESMQNLDSRLEAVIGNGEQASKTMRAIAASANETGIGLAQMGDTVARVIPAVKDFGMTAGDSVKIATNLAAALKLNGATAAEAGAVVTQFSQALGSGVLQGDELRSIMEGAPNLYRDMAKAMGVTIAQFKKMSSDGKITSDWLANFMLKNDTYTKQLAKMPKTVGYAWNTIKNDVSAAIWSVNKQGGIMAAISLKILAAWDKVKRGAGDLTDALGGTDGVVALLNSTGKALLYVGGILAGFKIASLLTSPAGVAAAALITLGAAFVTLDNDYQVWKSGGMSAIDWGHWGDEVYRLAEAFALTSINVKKTGDSINSLKASSFADWSIKKEIESISRMFNQLSNTINDVTLTARAVAQGNYGAATYYADRTVNPDRYYDADGKKLDPNGRGEKIDYADQYYRNQLNGEPNPTIPQNTPTIRQGWEDSSLPKTVPGVASNTANTTNNVTTTISAPITINAAPGMDPKAIGAEVMSQFKKNVPQQGAFNPQTLLIAGGAK